MCTWLNGHGYESFGHWLFESIYYDIQLRTAIQKRYRRNITKPVKKSLPYAFMKYISDSLQYPSKRYEN